MRTTLTAAVLSLGVLLVAACGDDDAGTAGNAGGATTAAADAEAEVTTTTVAGTTTTRAEPGAGDTASSGGDTASSDTAGGAATAGSGDITLASTAEGEVLTDADGMALYLFVPDDQGASTCYDQCAETWPPLPEGASVGEGLDPELLGSTTRDDGTVQATYNGWPLYHFASDADPGDVNGQGINDVWYLVDASGQPVGAEG